MIFDAIIGVVLSAFGWLVGLIPSAASIGLPDFNQFGAAVADSRIWQWVGWANWYMPVDLAVTILGARLAVWIVMHGFEFFTWLLTKIHVLGGAS